MSSLTAVLPEKENASAARKRARKSVGGDKRVSFGNISIHHYEKVDTSPAHPEPQRRKFERSSSFDPAEEETAPPPPPVQPPPSAPMEPIASTPEPPPPVDAAPAASPPQANAAMLTAPQSPAPSEVSDVFFSPASSVMDSQQGSPFAAAPSLTSLLVADAPVAVPALSQLLAQDVNESAAAALDDDDTAMEMTVAVGGILGGASQPVSQSIESRSAVLASEPGEDEDVMMEMTMGVGGILGAQSEAQQPQPDEPPPPPPPAPPPAATEDGDEAEDEAMEMTGIHGGEEPWSRQSTGGSRLSIGGSRLSLGGSRLSLGGSRLSLGGSRLSLGGSRLSLGGDGQLSGDASRRLSIKDTLVSMGTRLFGFGGSEPAGEDRAEDKGPGTPEWLSGPSPTPVDTAGVCETPGWLREADALRPSRKSRSVFDPAPEGTDADGIEADNPAPPAEPPPKAAEEPRITTFDEYLTAAGIHFLGAGVGRRHTSLGGNKAFGWLGVLDVAGGEESVAHKLLASSVLEPQLDQMHWASGEVQNCLVTLQEDYLEFQRDVAQKAPGFFSAPETKIPGPQLRKLKSRCRQTAREFWYHWRTTLEDDLAEKLQTAATSFQAELADVEKARSEVTQLTSELAVAMPPPPTVDVGALVAEKQGLARQLAEREATLVRAESSCLSLRRELARTDQELTGLRESNRAAEQKLMSLSSRLSSRTAPEASAQEGALGDDVLSALEVRRFAALGPNANSRHSSPRAS